MKIPRLAPLLTFVLLLAAGPARAQEAPTRYVITDHGAVGDAVTTSTAAIQSTIDRAAAAGGGVVVIPTGEFLTGALFFPDGVSLHLEEGAVLRGTTNLEDYRLVQSRWEGEEMIWISALINVFDSEGFRLTGTGTIDGSGDRWHAPQNAQRHLQLAARAAIPMGPRGGLPPTPDGQVSAADTFEPRRRGHPHH